jgi:hypothetical protein
VIPVIAQNVPKMILGDQFRLEHVLANLLSNAIKFSDVGSSIEILLTYNDRREGFVCFCVKDHGVGMTTEEQKSLFQPFQQIRPGELQKGKGSGLGLSICKMMMDLHEGFLGVDSKKREDPSNPLSGGSEFYFGIVYNETEVEEARKCFSPSISLKHVRASNNPSAAASSAATPMKHNGNTPAGEKSFRSSMTNSSSSSPLPVERRESEDQEPIVEQEADEEDCCGLIGRSSRDAAAVKVLICDGKDILLLLVYSYHVDGYVICRCVFQSEDAGDDSQAEGISLCSLQ